MTATSIGRGRARLVTVGAITGAIGILAVPGLVNAQESGIIGPPPTDPTTTLPIGIPDPETTTTLPIAIPDPDPTLPPGPGDLAIPDPEPTLPPGPGDLAIPDPDTNDPDGGGGGGGGGDVPAGGDATGNPVVAGDAPAAPAAPSGQLPETGVDSTVLVVLGVTLTAAGTAIVTLARRRDSLAQG